MKIIREVQCEVTMSPLAAKELVIWLQKKIDNFEETFGEIKLPLSIKPEESDKDNQTINKTFI